VCGFDACGFNECQENWKVHGPDYTAVLALRSCKEGDREVIRHRT
jgi:hypothetical protein